MIKVLKESEALTGRRLFRGVRFLLRPTAFWLYRMSVRLSSWYQDQTTQQDPGGLPVPPALMRFRVGETLDAEIHLTVGRNTVNNISHVLGSNGRSLIDFESILDFGCGCGRTLTWLRPEAKHSEIFGTDVDQESILWCQANLAGLQFSVNQPDPPLQYAEKSFDLVYAISVFTHLDQERQWRWFKELHRILRPGGWLLISLHGRSASNQLSGDDLARLVSDGFLFKTSSKLNGLLPDWYHTAYHTQEYVEIALSSIFRIVAFLPGGFGLQDAVILERAMEEVS